jgi:hypothetical protein
LAAVVTENRRWSDLPPARTYTLHEIAFAVLLVMVVFALGVAVGLLLH